jgi:hypothetical protein
VRSNRAGRSGRTGVRRIQKLERRGFVLKGTSRWSEQTRVQVQENHHEDAHADLQGGARR